MVQHLTTLATMSEHSGPKPQDRPLVRALAWRGLPPLNECLHYRVTCGR